MFRRHGEWHEERRERVLGKGDFKYVILDLLQEQPSHGYQVIKRLEERFGGMYAPSPGAVYPTLQLLEDMGAVTATAEEGRKVYEITDEGRRILAERGARVDDIRERMERWRGPWGGEQHDPRRLLRDIARSFGKRQGPWDMDPDKARRISEVVLRARREIEAILAEPPAATGPRPEPEPGPRTGPASGPAVL